MRRMLDEMEAAARAARGAAEHGRDSLPPLRASSRLASPARAHDRGPTQAPDTPIAARPGGKVEIYRRRPGTSSFDRTET
jgi:hypothetical protein